MIDPPWLIGEAPSRSSEGKKAFEGRSGERLTGLLGRPVREAFRCANLFGRWPGKGRGKGSAWSSDDAARAAASWASSFARPEKVDGPLVFVGNRVARAFGRAFGFRPPPPFTWQGVLLGRHGYVDVATIPHPSGVSRWWNDPENVERARRFLLEAAERGARSGAAKETTSLGHVPDGAWAFDADVTARFGDMLERSIPAYSTMREAVERVADRFLAGTVDLGAPRVLDFGCSRGEAVAPLVERYPEARFLLVDASAPMVAAARDRFAAISRVEVVEANVGRDGLASFPFVYFRLELAVLSLMFVPLEHRARVAKALADRLEPEGALVVVEKVVGSTPEIDDHLLALYLRMKRDHGYSEVEVERKRLALENVLVPLSARWNEELLRAAGFRHVEAFWRCLNFVGFLCLR